MPLRIFYRLFASVTAVCCLVDFVLPCAKGIESNSGARLLFSFEDTKLPEEVRSISAKIELVKEAGVSDGKQAIEVAFDSGADTSGVSFQPSTPWDWSQLQEFGVAFDATNVGDYSTQLYVEVKDESGNSQVRTVCVPQEGETESFYLVLHSESLNKNTGLRDDPPAWSFTGKKLIWLWGSKQLDLSKIARVRIYTDTILHDRKLVIDNVRVVEDLQAEPSYLQDVCDRFGQSAKSDFPHKVTSESQLKELAEAELSQLAESEPMADRSKFGGWTSGPRLEATGYFRTEKVGNKWAFVDPEGYLFFSTGIANIRMANTATITGVDFKSPTVRRLDPEETIPEDSKPFVQTTVDARKTRFIASKLRHQLFQWLPDYDDSLADHYTYVRSVHQGPVEHGEAFSFYQANLERRYGKTGPNSYLTKWRDVTVDRMLDWGFTSMGNWVDPSFYHVKRIPYFANGWIIGDFKTLSSGNDYWSPMPDPFDPEFKRRANVTASTIAEEVRDSQWCVGVFIDNEKGWGRMGSFESQYGIVLNAMPLDARECPYKAAVSQFLQEKYESIDRLNAAWQTEITSWEALDAGVSLGSCTDAVRQDVSDLLNIYARKYFQIVDEALNEVMPHHLYMGVRMAHWGLTPEVVAAAKQYSDVISYNFYKEGIRDEDWDFLPEVDMPSIIGEFHMGTTSDTGLFHPGLIVAANQEDRGRMFKDYMESVIDNPYFVGAHWFQYIDSPLTGRSYDGENYNVGFVTITDVPYPEMVKAAKELNRSLYQRRFGRMSPERLSKTK